MKKLLVLPLALMLLASCVGGNGSSGTSTGGSTGASTGGSTGTSVGESTGTSVGDSTGTSTTPAGDWNEATRAEMTSAIGIVLPYIELDDLATTYGENSYGIMGAGGEAELTAYCSLLEPTFNYVKTVPDSYGDDMLVYESKDTSVGVRIEVQTYTWYDDSTGTSGEDFYLVAYRPTMWPTEALALIGVEDSVMYGGTNKLTYERASYGDGTELVQIYVFDGTPASYSATLTAAGFYVGDASEVDPDYEGIYYAYPEIGYTNVQFYDNGELGLVIEYSHYQGE